MLFGRILLSLSRFVSILFLRYHQIRSNYSFQHELRQINPEPSRDVEGAGRVPGKLYYEAVLQAMIMMVRQQSHS
jgi:hypothetical protein